MNRIVSFCLLLLFCASSLSAQTMVSGGIYSNTTWSLANSPYIVTGNIVVFPGKTLTIEPGVEVRVQGNAYPSGTGIYIEVRGRILAIGTANAPISFKADGPVTDPWSWAGITVKTSQGGDGDFNYVNFSNAYLGFGSDGHVPRPNVTDFRNCNFTDNHKGANPWFSVRFIDCNFDRNGVAIEPYGIYGVGVELRNCIFDSNETVLTYVLDTVVVDSCVFTNNVNPLVSLSQATVRNSLFDGNTIAIYNFGGLVSDCEFINNNTAVANFSVGTMTNCVIRDNQLGADLGLDGSFVDNEVFDNVIGVKIHDNTIGFQNNRICSNTLYNVENAADKNISLVGNCFCESDSTIAETLLFDGYDDITRGLFNYALYDSSCTNIVQLISKVTIVTSGAAPLPPLFQVYPNPAQEVLFIAPSAAMDGATMRLMTLQGQVLRTFSVQGLTRIDIADLAQGTYLLDYLGASRSVIKWIKF